MIARLSYVMCDECGNPGAPADNAREARAEARRQGFVRIDGRDLCKECKPKPQSEPHYTGGDDRG
ncbi:MAG TPA: hypothetical protein VFJ76_07900 [Solirubrobacterales bacterium]|nr:hypothetical protein [Solirubrobacterales bacterium]